MSDSDETRDAAWYRDQLDVVEPPEFEVWKNGILVTRADMEAGLAELDAWTEARREARKLGLPVPDPAPRLQNINPISQ